MRTMMAKSKGKSENPKVPVLRVRVLPVPAGGEIALSGCAPPRNDEKNNVLCVPALPVPAQGGALQTLGHDIRVANADE